MTLLEEKFLSVLPNRLNDIANENGRIADELATLNDRLKSLIEILGEKQ